MTYSAFNPVSKVVAGKGYDDATLATAVCTNCSNGASPPQGSPGCPFQRGTPASMGHAMVQMLAVADTPSGPWHQVELHGLTAGWDWNTAVSPTALRWLSLYLILRVLPPADVRFDSRRSICYLLFLCAVSVH